jgi:hypothetical protein
VNNSDERDYEEERANRRMMEEEHESELQHETDNLFDSMFKPDYCPVCGRVMSTHFFCEGPDS